MMTTVVDALAANGTLASWGESVGGYYGQTFVAADSSLTELKFTFASNSGNTDYRVYIVSWSDSQPQTILWESPLLVVGTLSSAQTVTVSIPSLQLTPGTEYAFILDTAAGTLNGPSTGSLAALDPFSTGYQGGYSEGEFFFSPFETGTPQGDLALAPIILSSFDLAFSLTFAPAPLTATIHGGNGRDTIFGDRLASGTQDTIFGGNGDDALFGLAGADVLYGQAGNDRLTGGTGPDDFVFAKNGGADIVTDFHSGEDDVVLDGITLKLLKMIDLDGNGIADAALQFSSGSAILLNVGSFNLAEDLVLHPSPIAAHFATPASMDLF